MLRQHLTHDISIHALREEGDVPYKDYTKIIAKFLSTPSARRAPVLAADGALHRIHFYPRPPRGGRLDLTSDKVPQVAFLSTPSARRATGENASSRGGENISIHALREEGDLGGPHYKASTDKFLSTPSARRATWHLLMSPDAVCISIHALREEGDLHRVTCCG